MVELCLCILPQVVEMYASPASVGGGTYVCLATDDRSVFVCPWWNSMGILSHAVELYV